MYVMLFDQSKHTVHFIYLIIILMMRRLYIISIRLLLTFSYTAKNIGEWIFWILSWFYANIFRLLSSSKFCFIASYECIKHTAHQLTSSIVFAKIFLIQTFDWSSVSSVCLYRFPQFCFVRMFYVCACALLHWPIFMRQNIHTGYFTVFVLCFYTTTV